MLLFIHKVNNTQEQLNIDIFQLQYFVSIDSGNQNQILEKVTNKTTTNSDKDTYLYSGEWKDGAPNGEGVGYGLNEENEVIWIYQGSWVNGLMDGYGEITYPGSIAYYKGEWKNGKRFGDGKRRMSDGTVIPLTYVEYGV